MLKKSLMWSILVSIPLTFALLCIEGYYAYHKLTYEGVFCGSFARVDEQAGWVLAGGASSCYGLWKTGHRDERAFYSEIFTDRNGFRAASPGGETPAGGVMLVGDSWTFGYGVDYAHSFPGQLDARLGGGVVAVASPAYGAAQALVLAERWLEPLSPRAMVYLDIGHWERSACTGATRPRLILKPCYWVDPLTGQPELVPPPPGFVPAAAAWGLKPGGMLGAGEVGWDYFLVSRPLSKVLGLLARAGLVSGMAHDFRAVAVDRHAIRQGVAEHLIRIATESAVPLWILDPGDAYAEFDPRFQAAPGARIARIGRAAWKENVLDPASALPAEERNVPQDGHFGPGTNALIADYLARLLGGL